jgi:hypothetical protein
LSFDFRTRADRGLRLKFAAELTLARAQAFSLKTGMGLHG